MRYHPAIIAQAAATAGLLTEGRFNLGVGTGEALNEHVTGEPWPAAEVRRDMLEEAVAIIAELFAGGQVTVGRGRDPAKSSPPAVKTVSRNSGVSLCTRVVQPNTSSKNETATA